MFTLGFLREFKKGEPLSDEDISGRLNPKMRIHLPDSCLMDDMAIIKLNSTFLEVVDPYYKDRGLATCMGFVCLFITAGFTIAIQYVSLSLNGVMDKTVFCIMLPTILVCLWVISTESFRTTHYPIRLNRKNRLIHVFHRHGKVETYHWNDAYFTVRSYRHLSEGNIWYLCAHILDKDKKVIKKTFCLSMYSSKYENVIKFWELIRRYMEEKDGAKQVADMAWLFLPIAEKREDYFFGLFYLLMRGPNAFVQVFMLLLVLPQSIGRWFSMITSRIPHWPKEVEQMCEIAKDDPYNYDANSPGLTKYWHYLFHWRLKNYTAVSGKKWTL